MEAKITISIKELNKFLEKIQKFEQENAKEIISLLFQYPFESVNDLSEIRKKIEELEQELIKDFVSLNVEYFYESENELNKLNSNLSELLNLNHIPQIQEYSEDLKEMINRELKELIKLKDRYDDKMLIEFCLLKYFSKYFQNNSILLN